MQRVGFGILLLLILSMSSGFGVGEPPVYETRQKPKPNVGEIVKHYPGTFLSCQDLNGPILHAWILAGLDRWDEAIERLEQGVAERNSMMFALSVMREFETLHGDSRYEALVRRIGS